MDVTNVYLVRHAHAVWAEDDSRPLSVAGAEAAHDVAVHLASLPIAAIYSSPSRRAIETVTPLARQRHLEVRLIRDLRERELPVARIDDFEQVVLETWCNPAGVTNASTERWLK